MWQHRRVPSSERTTCTVQVPVYTELECSVEEFPQHDLSHDVQNVKTVTFRKLRDLL